MGVETKEPEIIIIYGPTPKPGYWAMHNHLLVLILILAIATLAVCFALAIRLCLFMPREDGY
ncbi:hypothetical protein AAVH_14167 [Aphelenchoides avenae]|nr:hypothetical protein AAVH_14167 [Aphelenchus avenae]